MVFWNGLCFLVVFVNGFQMYSFWMNFGWFLNWLSGFL